MFEKKFIAYLLYATLPEIRENAYKSQNKRLFELTNLLHKVPLSMLNDDSSKDCYKEILDNVKDKQIDEWFELREQEFFERFPEYN